MITEVKAWDIIGWENLYGTVKIKGGRTTYEAVLFNANGRQRKVLLAKLKITNENKYYQISRYVEPDTILEVNSDSFKEFMANENGIII